MKCLHLENNNGNYIVIPYSAIDRITVRPQKKWEPIKHPIFLFLYSVDYDFVETGKYELYFQTSGGNEGIILFNTELEANNRLIEITNEKEVP